MCLEGLEFLNEHLMVRIAGNKDNKVEIPEHCQLKGFEREPDINTLFDNDGRTLFLDLPEMFIMENDVVLDQAVLKFSFRIEQVLIVCVINTITTSKIVAFRDKTFFDREIVNPCDLFSYELEK